MVAANAQSADNNIPLFRHIDPLTQAQPTLERRSLILLSDRDFAPFSFRAAKGEATGLSVDLALAACQSLKISCSVVLKPFAELVPALEAGVGDLIISGVKLKPDVLKTLQMTRPYLWSSGRFAVAQDSHLTTTSVQALAGRRIGFVKGTVHAEWLSVYYGRSSLVGFAQEGEVFAALKAKHIDILFGDNLRVLFWLKGTEAAGCCKVLDAPYIDRDYFTTSLVFLARKPQDNETGGLVPAFDAVLDQLQASGITSQIFARYLPLGFFK